MERVGYDSQGAAATRSPVWKTDVSALNARRDRKYFVPVR